MLNNKINKILYNIDYIISNLKSKDYNVNNINSLLYDMILDFKIAYNFYKKYRQYNYDYFFKSIIEIKKINKLVDKNYLLLKQNKINQNRIKQIYNKILTYLYKIRDRSMQICQN